MIRKGEGKVKDKFLITGTSTNFLPSKVKDSHKGFNSSKNTKLETLNRKAFGVTDGTQTFEDSILELSMEYPGIHGATINSSKLRSATKNALGFQTGVTDTDPDLSSNSYRKKNSKGLYEESKRTPSDSMRQIFPRDAHSVI